VTVAAAAGGKALDFAWDAADPASVEHIRLLDEALWTTSGADQGYVVVPVREGLLIPAKGTRPVRHAFDTYAYEGCHMAMVGIVKAGAAALVTWDDPYVVAEVSRADGTGYYLGRQVLGLSLVLRKSARAARVAFLGKGDYNLIAAAYREVARERGWLVTWDEKLKGHADRAKYFGAVNFKL